MALLTENILIFQQMTAMMSNDFAIRNAKGEEAGFVHTQGALGSRMLKGSREFTITDSDDEPLLLVQDPLNFVRDTFVLKNPEGTEFGQVRKRFTFFKQRLDINLSSGETVELQGNLLGLDFEFTVQGKVVARVSRKWSGLAKGLLGHSTYAVTLEAAVPADTRKAIIGAMIALDLLRRKASNN